MEQKSLSNLVKEALTIGIPFSVFLSILFCSGYVAAVNLSLFSVLTYEDYFRLSGLFLIFYGGTIVWKIIFPENSSEEKTSDIIDDIFALFAWVMLIIALVNQNLIKTAFLAALSPLVPSFLGTLKKNVYLTSLNFGNLW